MGVLVMDVLAEDVVHAGVSGDVTGREEGDEEEGDTVEAVDVVLVDPLLAVLLHRARPLGQVRRWRPPPVYRPLVDLSTMEDRHVIVTYILDRATIHELCAQLEPDLMSAISQEDGPERGLVAAVEPVGSEDEEAEEEDIDNRNTVIHQYFQ
ncbi:hypothetical protein NDU88_002694 [Pleurodeles waltl]|uniref:Uncharacterized protein n=1 Tax=Pleurodeles waltl TaxID=8319 RepID=A0AAV7KW56_PLEWA|nr:hypothetical protein NDU88_002694 [Pleurodeles waltl]